jgi:hypothetical protein
MPDKVKYPRYTVEWCEADQMFIATCDWFPGHWAGDRDCVKALQMFTEYLHYAIGEDAIAAKRDAINTAYIS